MKTFFCVLFMELAALVGGVVIGYEFHQPQVVIAIQEVLVPVEKEVIHRVPEYVFVQVETIRIVPVEKTITKRIEPRPWDTIQEFEAWYKSKLWYMPSWVKQDGIMKRPDCDDWVEMIQEEAIRDGRSVSIALVSGGYFYGKYIPWLGGDVLHTGLFIMAGNDMYYYENYPWDFPKRIYLGGRD